KLRKEFRIVKTDQCFDGARAAGPRRWAPGGTTSMTLCRRVAAKEGAGCVRNLRSQLSENFRRTPGGGRVARLQARLEDQVVVRRQAVDQCVQPLPRLGA